MKNQRSKSKFRRTGKWLKFRAFKKKEQENKDAITLAPLHSGFQIHHIDQNEEKYEDLSKIENFVALNRYSHKLLHYIFTYYKRDRNVLERLKNILDKMLEINGMEAGKLTSTKAESGIKTADKQVEVPEEMPGE